MHDKRRCVRIPIQLPASIKIEEDSDSTPLGTTLDIGAKGLLLVSLKKFRDGDVFPLEVTLPFMEKLTVHVEVVWVKKEMINEKTSYQMGVRIIDNLKRDEVKFVKFVAQQMLHRPPADH